MTVRDWAEAYCRDRGMTPGAAKEIVDRVVSDPGMYLMRHRWDRDIAGVDDVLVVKYLETRVRLAVEIWVQKQARPQP